MSATVIDLVTPHLLRVVDLADKAERGMSVDWHVGHVVATTMAELGAQYNASVLVATYIEGLENTARQAPRLRATYIRVLQRAAELARGLWRN